MNTPIEVHMANSPLKPRSSLIPRLRRPRRRPPPVPPYICEYRNCSRIHRFGAHRCRIPESSIGEHSLHWLASSSTDPRAPAIRLAITYHLGNAAVLACSLPSLPVALPAANTIPTPRIAVPAVTLDSQHPRALQTIHPLPRPAPARLGTHPGPPQTQHKLLQFPAQGGPPNDHQPHLAVTIPPFAHPAGSDTPYPSSSTRPRNKQNQVLPRDPLRGGAAAQTLSQSMPM